MPDGEFFRPLFSGCDTCDYITGAGRCPKSITKYLIILLTGHVISDIFTGRSLKIFGVDFQVVIYKNRNFFNIFVYIIIDDFNLKNSSGCPRSIIWMPPDRSGRPLHLGGIKNNF